MKLSAAFVAAALAASRVHARPVADNAEDNHLVARYDLVGDATLQAAKRGTDVDLVTRSRDHDGQPLDHLLSRDSDIVQRNGITEILESVRWKLGSWWRNKEPGPYMESLYAEDAGLSKLQHDLSHVAHPPSRDSLGMELERIQRESKTLNNQIASETNKLTQVRQKPGYAATLEIKALKSTLNKMWLNRLALDEKLRNEGMIVPERTNIPEYVQVKKLVGT